MKYAAFLRGINVGGRTSIKMEALREVFRSLGHATVKTYIQSGNVIFESELADEGEITAEIEKAVEREFFKTNVMVRRFERLKELIENNPFAAEKFEEKLFHVIFLAEELSAEKAEMLLSNNRESEQFAVSGREVYCLLRDSTADSLLGKKYIDNKLKIPATARNWRTVNKMLEF